MVLIDSQLSRRQGIVDLSCAARHRAAQTYVPRRAFRSSIASFDSPDSPSDANGTGNGSAPPRSKWGARWGSKQPSQNIGLSPAEQAMRDQLLEKKRREAETRQAEIRKVEEARKAEEEEKRRKEELRSMKRRKPLNTGRRWDPMDTRGGEHVERSQETQAKNLPFHLRHSDWQCPECAYPCFGKFIYCPRCNCMRPNLPPDLNKTSREPRRGGASSLRFGRQQQSHADKEPRAHRDKVERAPKQPTEEDTSDKPAREAKKEKEPKKQKEPKESKEPQPEKAKTSKDPWTWDPSSLNLLEDRGQEKQPWKDSKRRTGRKQREDDDQDENDEDEIRRRREDRKRVKNEKARRKEVEAAPSPIFLPEFISVNNLADVLGVRPAQFVDRMEEMGFEGVTYSHILDAESAGLIAAEYNFEPIIETGEDDLTAAPEPEDPSSLPPRPPVVTIMGHVDHGKTTILDWLRNSSIAAGEHGGITQHIGAFSVAMPSGQTITFLDTPGHAAFLEMRRRGADVTDIVVLVVAADDSVKPQTVEAIKHATGAKVPVVVAISKVDKENVNIEKAKQDLSIHGVHVEDYGGDVQAIGVSGKTGKGMVELEEAIVTLSEMLDHRAEVEGNAEGWVIESTTKSYGRVTSVLIKRGTLRVGDIVVAGTAWARVRTLRNEAGVTIEEATPGMPVEIDGWREQPTAGTELLQAPSEQRAKDVVDYRLERTETQKLGEDATAINESRREVLEKRRQQEAEENGEAGQVEQAVSGPKPVNFIVKADVDGSSEAVLNSITAIGNNEVYANVLRSAVGSVWEFDIEHAASAQGHIISFNQPVEPAMLRMAESRGVKIMDHNIIYKLIDDVKDSLSEHLAPSVSQRVTGEAEISQVFEITIKRQKIFIAGCKVRNGMMQRARKVRVFRGQDIIYDGRYYLFIRIVSYID